MPLPVTVFSGFLGAGKTTLLARLLAETHGVRVGVVLNEIGQAGIDRIAADRRYVELTDGCVCCVHNPDLVAALTELSARGDLDRVVLETTGLADPLPLTWTLTRPDLHQIARLDSVVVVVDAANYAHTRASEWEAQVRCADLVVLSKLDLIDARAAVRARQTVALLNPTARIVDGEMPAALLFDGAPTERTSPGRAPVARHSDWGVVSVGGGRPYAPGPLEDFLETLPAQVFRAKGILPLSDGRWLSFHAVGGRLALDFEAQPPADGESRLLLFGRELDGAQLTALVESCRAPA
jgi:G3E family GTPase